MYVKKDYLKRNDDNGESKKKENMVDKSLGMISKVFFVHNILQYHEEWLLDFGASHVFT